ncbi:caspase family protein [Desulfobacter curvatus]|uniref:caspase family protein n=1 Tax=Desulfobacter curvatus TaxID=2290 RepID=UPI00146CCC72|nr:caspase family protein [Desulfobacter curvatus]
MVRRIGVDRDERFMVSGSLDKTVRLWDLKSGRLLQTLRVPLGKGALGKVFSVAISPDGADIAAGGWLGSEQDRIFIFDRQTGNILQVISGLPNVVRHLSYSPDGKYLVASLGASNGIRVYKTRTYTQVAEDAKYDSDSYWADFDTAGRLVTISFDGYIRLYDEGFSRILKRKAPGGDWPFSAEFAPDDSRIAVGYEDSTRVDVLSAKTLALLFSPDASGTNGNLHTVAWSRDGRYLYAGGLYAVPGKFPIRCWSGAGRGDFTDLEAGNNTVMDIKPLSDGSIAVGAADPYLVVLQPDGKIRWKHQGDIADFREQVGDNGILLSSRGDQVQFGFEAWSRRSACFSLKTWQLELAPKETGQMLKPVTDVPGLEISDWVNEYTPKLNNKSLELDQYEQSRSLAIAPDHKSFLLGADWSLRLFDKTGRQLWKVAAPGTAWAVNISGDGKLAVAGYGDGTLHWYRLSDGEELLALFPHRDGKRWVAWTPEGFYQASAGGEDLIGWHLNHGSQETPEFFGASRFRDQFYRPDVVSRVLETLDVKEALALADRVRGKKTIIKAVEDILPPVITILSPAAGTETTSKNLVLFYKAESSTDDIIDVTPRVGDRPAKVLEHVFEKGKDKQGRDMMMGNITVEVPPEDVVVSLIARNRHGDSEPADFTTNWAGRKDWYKPNLYVLAIGVSCYDQKHLKLNYAAKDAADFVNAMKKQEGGLYKKVMCRLVVSDKTRKDATQNGILDGLDWIEHETTSRDVAMVFLSGHGVNDTEGNYNFLPQNGDPCRLHRTGINDHDFKKFLSNIPGKTVLFFDSCRSGNVRMDVAKGDQQADVDKFANELADAGSGVIVFSSSTGKQLSFEKKELENGVFTEALLEGIEGRADFYKDWHISIAELEVYLTERVKELTNGDQKPVSAKPKSVEDMKITRVRR